jgi:lipopolysaccharide export system protein LptC
MFDARKIASGLQARAASLMPARLHASTLRVTTLRASTLDASAIASDHTAPDTTYRDALHHSARVRLMRRGIPIACVLGVFGPLVWVFISPFSSSIANVQIGAVSVSGSKITMEAPKLSGFRKDQKSYEVTAREAVQDIRQPTVIELNKLVGRLEQERNSFAHVTSDWGRFDQSAELLDLKGNVKIRTDDGNEVDMSSAKIEMKSGRVVSTEPVEVRSKSGTVNADRVELKDNAKIIIFEGRVRSVLYATDAAIGTPKAEAETEAPQNANPEPVKP